MVCWCIIDISGLRIVYIPLEVGVIVAWQAFGGMGIGSGSLISGFLTTGGEFELVVDIWTGGKLGWNMGLRRVTIFVGSGLVSASAAAFLAFFLAFLDFPTGCGSATMTCLGGSGRNTLI